MPSKLQLQLGTHRRRCVTSVESSMRKCCLRPSAVLEHFWASTPISFSFRCPWDFSTSTLRQHFCFSAGKRQQKNMEKPKQSTHRDLSSQGTLSMKTALGEDTTRQSNVQVLWDDMMIDVGIFGSYLIDSERKFMGFGSSNPHIALGFTQFLTVWYIYIYISYRFKHAERCAMIKLKRPTLESMPAEVAERIFWLAIWTGLQWFAHAWITCWHHKLPHVSRARP